MKRCIAVAIAAFSVSVAMADVEASTTGLDKATCNKVAEEFQRDLFKMSLDNLETFRLCVSNDMPEAMARQYNQSRLRIQPVKLQDAE